MGPRSATRRGVILAPLVAAAAGACSSPANTGGAGGGLVSAGAPKPKFSRPPGNNQPAGRLMIVGDSITQGSSGDFTWRYRLYKHLTANHIPVTYVGPRTDLYNNVTNTQGDHSYADRGFDQHHDSVWGRTMTQAKDTLPNEITGNRPDIVLVLLGIDDIGFGVADVEMTALNVRTLIINARGAKPDVRLILGKLLPTLHGASDPAFAASVAQVNRRVVEVAAEMSSAESPVFVADTGTDYAPSDDTWDGSHPNARGEVKIAAAFADALADGLGVGPRFERPLPVVPIGPRTVPALRASTAGARGEINLSWSLSPGTTGYWVLLRRPDLEADFTRLPYALNGTTSRWTAGMLAPGVVYEFKLQTTKGMAMGVFSNTVRATARA
ncbi:MAG TPA: GDSL-type esterase/lipase family protein [Rugosimonospora sp.]|nr:GDSL-type esterase/lipase family protein [Rugosimonospora sp.]